MNRDMIKEFKDKVKGHVRPGECMARHTSFRIGGPADIWIEPQDIKELRKAINFTRKHKIPIFVIGGGTNLLVGDDGFKGAIIHLGAPFFKKVAIKGNAIKAGAGFNISKLVRLCCDKGLSGMESLIGIPGTVGGAVYMNAGGSTNPIFKNIGDLIVSLKVMDYKGRIKNLKRKDLKFGYRSSNLSLYIILEATLKLKKDNSALLSSRCTRFLSMKKQKQALDVPSAGCVFKNPENSQFTCGQMIDMLGLKGVKRGGAEVSEKHANFIINRNGARSKDVLGLINFIRDRVMENYRIPLELEIKII